MKNLSVLCLIGTLSLALGASPVNDRDCVYDDRGICVDYCPDGTYGYSLGCGYRVPEPTCDQPHPVKDNYEMCDLSECYCNPPTVRNTQTNKCVPLDQCPTKKVE